MSNIKFLENGDDQYCIQRGNTNWTPHWLNKNNGIWTFESAACYDFNADELSTIAKKINELNGLSNEQAVS